MHKIALSGLAALAFSGMALADAQIDLGDAKRVTRLFAYPNNCNVICYRDWTLEQTVEHYLTQSVRRDGYANAKVTVNRDNDKLHAQITDVPAGYTEPCASCSTAASWPTRAPPSSTRKAAGTSAGTCSCPWEWPWRTAAASNCCTSRRITR